MNQSTENIFDLSMVTENLIPFEDSYPSIFDAHFNHSWHPFHSLSFPALKTAPTHLPKPRFFSARQERGGQALSGNPFLHLFPYRSALAFVAGS